MTLGKLGAASWITKVHSMISAIWSWELVPPGGHSTFFSGDVKGLLSNT